MTEEESETEATDLEGLTHADATSEIMTDASDAGESEEETDVQSTDEDKRTYDRLDEVDDISHRPDFAILVYPWNMYDVKTDALVAGVEVPKNCPPTFLVHTDDDRSSSLGAVLFYTGLKKHGIAAELHVYGNGGHGYGLRPVPKSQISGWPDHAAHWLGARGFLK